HSSDRVSLADPGRDDNGDDLPRLAACGHRRLGCAAPNTDYRRLSKAHPPFVENIQDHGERRPVCSTGGPDIPEAGKGLWAGRGRERKVRYTIQPERLGRCPRLRGGKRLWP